MTDKDHFDLDYTMGYCSHSVAIIQCIKLYYLSFEAFGFAYYYLVQDPECARRGLRVAASGLHCAEHQGPRDSSRGPRGRRGEHRACGADFDGVPQASAGAV
eukprot:5718100-Pyramimonas_sp.AAC.1